jgi:hypothetical protein
MELLPDLNSDAASAASEGLLGHTTGTCRQHNKHRQLVSSSIRVTTMLPQLTLYVDPCRHKFLQGTLVSTIQAEQAHAHAHVHTLPQHGHPPPTHAQSPPPSHAQSPLTPTHLKVRLNASTHTTYSPSSVFTGLKLLLLPASSLAPLTPNVNA